METLSDASNASFSTHVNTSPCTNPCMCKEQSPGNQIAKVLLSFSPAWEQTAEANTNFSITTGLHVLKCPKPITLHPFPLSQWAVQTREKANYGNTACNQVSNHATKQHKTQWDQVTILLQSIIKYILFGMKEKRKYQARQHCCL